MKLYKRSEDRDAPYYVRFQVRGKMHQWCAKTNDQSLARKRAKAYRDALVAEKYSLVSTMKARTGGCTFEELFRAYKALPYPDNPHTKKRNVGAMQAVLRASGYDGGDRLDVLSVKLGTKFQQAASADLTPASVNATMRMAKSLFSKRAVMSYELDLPEERIADFLRTMPLPEPKKLIQLPGAEAMATAHKLLPAHPEHYRAFLLGAYCGLRSGEIIAARRDWIKDGMLYVGGTDEFTAKGQDWRVVAIAPDVLAEVAKKKDGDLLVTDTNTFNMVARELPAMLKGYGFPDKPVQSLRRWFGSQVAARFGIRDAQKALGHSSVQVTEEYYARQLSVPGAISPTSQAVPAGAGETAVPAA